MLLSSHDIDSNAEMAWTLRGPDGLMVDAQLFRQSNSSDVADQDAVHYLPAGEYQLEVRNPHFSFGGGDQSFSFRLLDLDSVSIPLVPNTITSGSLNPAASTTVYRFDATAGELITLDAQTWAGAVDAVWRLTDSQGAVILSEPLNTDSPTVSISATGTYYLFIEGHRTDVTSAPGYTFNVVKPVVTSAGYALNDTAAGLLGAAGERHDFTFNISAVTSLYFDSLTNNSSWCGNCMVLRNRC